MKYISFYLLALITFVLQCKAEEVKTTKAAKNPYLSMTGGLLPRPGVTEGRIAILNAQHTITSTNFSASAKYFSDHLKLKVDIRDIDAITTPHEACNALLKDGSNFAVVVVDDQKCDTALSVFPEKRFSLVNINGIRTKDCTTPFLIARTRKEVIRAILYVAGGVTSQHSIENLLGAIFKPEDLDRHTDNQIPVDVIGRCITYLPACGCNVNVMVPYRKACQEGWAPQPTNDIQKVIWEKIHTAPSKPIKITFDKGRQKPVVK